MKNRVVITGVGALTPVGNSVKTTWNNLLNGVSGIDTIKSFDASCFKSTIAGEIKNFDYKRLKDKYNIKRIIPTATRFLIQAIDEAYIDSGLHTLNDAFLLTGSQGKNKLLFPENATNLLNFISNSDPNIFSDKTFQKYLSFEQEVNKTPFIAANIFNIKRPPINIQVACATGEQIVFLGYELIKSGWADKVICAATHVMDPLKLTEFTLLEALSTYNNTPEKASRPFDKTRNGFVISEGAGAVILENSEHALKRKAKVYAEISGGGVTNDSYRITDPHPEGEFAYRAMKKAVINSSIELEKITYINAHGTSTRENDKIETKAIKKLFGGLADNLKVNSTKSMIGHMILASGVIEIIVAALSIYENKLHPTINLEAPDPECNLDYIAGNKYINNEVKAALCNSFGFGGQNVSLLINKYDHCKK